MNSNKSDGKEDKVNEKQTKNSSQNRHKFHSTKVYSNNRRFDSFSDKTNEKSNNYSKNNNRSEDSYNNRDFRNNYSHNSNDYYRRRNNYYDYDSHNQRYKSRTFESNRRSVPTYSQYVSNQSNGGNTLSDPNRNRFHRNDNNFSNYPINRKRYPKRESSPEVHENLQQKLDELTALKSIFDENILTVDEKELKGRFLAEPVINNNKLNIIYEFKNINRNNGFSYRYDNKESNKLRDNCDSGVKCETQEFCVQHLPPIELYFELSRKYPLKLNPKFLISCKWLTRQQLEKICEKLEALYYDSQMEVLFTWFSFLQNEVLSFLEIDSELDITPIVNQRPESFLSQNSSKSGAQKRGSNQRIGGFTPQIFRGERDYDSRAAFEGMGAELIPHLKAYDEYKRKETFNKSYNFCKICFSSNLGEDCVVFPCDHIYCKTCIRGYFTTLIKEGTVNQLKCPETDCQTSAPNYLVRELITGELFDRYDKLMTDSLIGTLSDAYYCPRKMCGNLVIGDPDSSLAHCTQCRHAFCKNCKQTYHGFDPCNMFRDPQQRKQILDKYQNSNATEKAELEKIYGRKQLVGALEEAATEKWLEDMSKRCPHCKASIEKSDGCNKMACWRCNTYFCWLCLQHLPTIQPYSHFNNPDSKCFNQLFRGVQFDAEEFFEDQFD